MPPGADHATPPIKGANHADHANTPTTPTESAGNAFSDHSTTPTPSEGVDHAIAPTESAGDAFGSDHAGRLYVRLHGCGIARCRYLWLKLIDKGAKFLSGGLEQATENMMGEVVVDQRPVETAARTLITAFRGGHRLSATVCAYKSDRDIFHMRENLTAEAGVLQVVAHGGVIEVVRGEELPFFVVVEGGEVDHQHWGVITAAEGLDGDEGTAEWAVMVAAEYERVRHKLQRPWCSGSDKQRAARAEGRAYKLTAWTHLDRKPFYDRYLRPLLRRVWVECVTKGRQRGMRGDNISCAGSVQVGGNGLHKGDCGLAQPKPGAYRLLERRTGVSNLLRRERRRQLRFWRYSRDL
eukprot:6172393-Pleurochrysis_carterae.AAC.3